MPQVLILRVVSFSVYLEGDVVRLSVLYLLLAALEIPNSPGSDYLHIGSISLYSQLKSYLVVALAGAAVADSVSALCDSYLSYSLSDDGACERSTQQILIFIYSACLHGGVYIIFDEFFLQIFDIKLGSACLDSLFLKTVKLGTLTNVTRYGDHLAVVVVFFEPRNDDRSVESSGVSENNFFDFLSH